MWVPRKRIDLWNWSEGWREEWEGVRGEEGRVEGKL